MKKAILAALLVATTAAAMPASAGTHKLTFDSNHQLAGQSLEYSTWNQSKCDTYLDTTKAQNRRLITHCIGKMSKNEYADRFARFMYDYRKADDQRVKDVTKLAAKALVHPDIEWKSDSRQKHLKNGKIAAAVLGAVTAALPAMFYGGSIFSVGMFFGPGGALLGL